MEEGIGGVKIRGVEEKKPGNEGEVTDAADAIAKNMFQISLHTSQMVYIMSEQAKITAQSAANTAEITKALYALLGNERVGRALDSLISGKQSEDPWGDD
jgi:hypothetical protein